MAPWRHSAASVVAASAVLLTGQTGVVVAQPAPASQAARQGFRAAAQIAADAYRAQRRRILEEYRAASRDAHNTLRFAVLQAETAQHREAAWRDYAKATQPLRKQAHTQMQQARADFRAAVESARDHFGVTAEPRTFSTLR